MRCKYDLCMLLFVESICNGVFYPYGIKSRTLRRYPGRFGPVSFRSGHFGLNHFGQFFVVSILIGGSFLPGF